MSQQFFFNSTVHTKGILNSFYSQGEQHLWDVIDVYAKTESIQPAHLKEYAFKYNNESLYWIGTGGAPGYDFLSFCFKNHYAKILGFELGTSLNGATLPENFSFSSSIDNKTWKNEVFYWYPYVKSDRFYFTYQSEVSKCFKLTCIKSIIMDSTLLMFVL